MTVITGNKIVESGNGLSFRSNGHGGYRPSRRGKLRRKLAVWLLR